jgi:hypothetical protein
MTGLSQGSWRKAGLSVRNGGCAEVADLGDDARGLRDSRTPAAGAHVVGRQELAAFLAAAKSGRFNI